MMRWLVSALVIVTVATCGYAAADDAVPVKIQWITDISEGLRHAKVKGKPSMLYFAADWCAPCIELKKSVFSDTRVVEASLRLINIYVDVDQNYEAVAAYKVRGIPEIFFLNPDGEIVARYSGARTAAGFVKQMNTIADQHSR